MYLLWTLQTGDDDKALDVLFDVVAIGDAGPSLEASERGFVLAFFPNIESIT